MRLLLLSLALLIAVLAPHDAFADTYPSEDPCIGESLNSPTAVCTDVEVSEWRISNSWSLDLSTQVDFMAECLGRGGVLSGIEVPPLTCTGEADWTEENFVPMSQAVAAGYYSSLTGNVADTGWMTVDGDPRCSQTVVLGLSTNECRQLSLAYSTGNGLTANTYFNGRRQRDVRCPNGYVPILNPQMIVRCKQVLCGPLCQNSSGVKQPSLANVRREPVFASSGSMLNFDRIWTSQGTFNPGDGQSGPGPAVGSMNLGWSHTFNKRLSPAGTRIGVLASIQGPDGSVMFYGLDGKNIQATSGFKEKLQQISGAAWQLTKTDGSVESFNSSGQLVSIATRGAGRIDITYSNGLINTVTDQSGRSLQFFHDASGRMTRANLPDGEYLTFKNTLRGVIQSITHSDGSVRSFRYDEKLMLTEATDESGNITNFEYGSDGQLSAKKTGRYFYMHSGSPAFGWLEQTSFTKDTAYSKTSSSDALGAVTTQTFAPLGGVMKPTDITVSCAGCDSRATTYTYDSSNRLKTITEPSGNITALSYDALGRVSVQHEMAVLTAGVVTAYGRRTETTWHPTLNLPSERRVFSANNVLVGKRVWTYDSEGRTLTGSRVDPVTAAAQTTTYAYCSWTDVYAPGSTCTISGLVKSVDGPRTDVNDITSFVYRPDTNVSGCNTQGPCHRKGDLWKVVDADGHFDEVQRYDAAGRIVLAADKNGVRTLYQYDAHGWLISRTVLGGNDSTDADDATTLISYRSNGLVDRITEPDGSFLKMTYNVANRLTIITDQSKNTITYTLDGAGNRASEKTRDEGGALHRNLSRTFTKFGEIKFLADSQDIATEYSYDTAGNLDTVTDAYGRVSSFANDPLGRLIQSVGNNNGSGNEQAVTSYAYDALDNLVTVTDPKDLPTDYHYDAFGNLLSLVSPDSGTATYQYDRAGNRVGQIDARGIELAYAYDAANRLTAITVPNEASGGISLASFGYDVIPQGCSLGQTFNVGRLSSMYDPSGDTAYCYDRRGNVVRKTQRNNGGQSHTLAYDYTLADRITTITYPSGLVVDYTRNAGGQITGVSARSSEGVARVDLVTSAQYKPFGPMSMIVFGNGRVLNKSYDLDYAIQSVADSEANGLAIGYSIDDVGNIVGLSERQNGGATAARNVEYDGLDRLAALKNGATTVQGFSYDATGNRTSKASGNTAAYEYGATSHRLNKVGTVTRTYDAAGNSTAIGTKHYEYDDRGRMSRSLTGATVLRDYQYNALGQRMAKIHPTTATSTVYFVYDEAGKLMGEYKPDGAMIKEYIWLDDTLVAVRGGYAGHKFQYVLTDHLNTPRAVVLPSTNAIIWRWDLTGSAFGEHAAQNDPDGDGTSYVFNLRYPGQYFDSETGLHYNYFRDYEPETGRYVQSDPIGLRGGVSTFSYVGSRPLLAIDSFGLLGEWLVKPTQRVNSGISDGSVNFTYPGAAPSPAVTNSAARTVMDWTVSAKCGCDSVLDEVSVTFTPMVLQRKKYASPAIKRIVQSRENEHVDDLVNWFKGARTGAELVEKSLMAMPPSGSQSQCESAADAAIRKFLESGAASAAEQSAATRHVGGRHNLPPGSYSD